jgi:VanZ family protein
MMPAPSIERLVSTLLPVAFAGCIAALAVLALLPAEAMTRSPMGGHVEHFVAFLGTTLVMELAFRRRPHLVLRCALLIGYAAILEIGQVYSPERHAAFQDFAFGSGGVVLGGLLLRVARQRLSSLPSGVRPAFGRARKWQRPAACPGERPQSASSAGSSGRHGGTG